MHQGLDKKGGGAENVDVTILYWHVLNAFTFTFRGSSSTAKRLKGAGRRIINKNFDQQLVEWVLQKRAENTRLSGRAIQQQAELFLKQIDGVDGKIKVFNAFWNTFL